MRTNSEVHLAGDRCLRRSEEGFEIAPDRIKKLPFVEESPVEVTEVLFPKHLFSGQNEFLEFTMGSDQQMSRRSFEPDTAFDPQNGIAQMDAATDSVLPANCIEPCNN